MTTEKIQVCLSLIFQIGIACSSESPRDRKDIDEVISELRSIRLYCTSSRMLFVQRLNINIDVACSQDFFIISVIRRLFIQCVSGFGLARILPNLADNVSGNQTSSIGIRGTVGYAAPGVFGFDI
ncbi:hypothetical protein DVH24_024596 [Malus domestica]|uniref:Serine-threonine/tyrosine-protein kinase catalytic domain-containing protein n=1 Tax=Malus domestica TaxID=3750 RepID=A0A498JMU6_MALDO|nr:hypothetical protein DVH24_024596 [Malus domestica]